MQARYRGDGQPYLPRRSRHCFYCRVAMVPAQCFPPGVTFAALQLHPTAVTLQQYERMFRGMSDLVLYFDETGSRLPDKKADASRLGRDWFALGGIIVDEDDEDAVRNARDAFAAEWGLNAPFHLTDMMAEKKAFSWLGRIKQTEREAFWSGYGNYLSHLPVVGVACVIDRPGYVKRGYLEKYQDRWLLCRSAFDILVERAAKYADAKGKRLRIIFEGAVGVNDIIKGYYMNLRDNGLAFDASNSGKYGPLAAHDFKRILNGIEYKLKDNKLLQVADSYVYSIARNGYDKHFPLYRRLRDASRIINFALENDQIKHMGVKYYCFDKP